jgi:hypothetical protein
MPIDGNNIPFRPHRFGFFLTLAVLLGLGLASLVLSAQLHWAWLAGAALVAMLGGRLASRYVIGALALRGVELVVYQGAFVVREVTVPIWAARLKIRQGLFGRLLDAGTVVVTIDERPLHLRVAQLRALRRLLAERKLQLLALTARHRRILPPAPAWVHAGELEDQRW